MKLPNLPPGYWNIQNEIDRLSRAVGPSLATARELDQALKPVYAQQTKMALAISNAGAAMFLTKSIVEANARVQELISGMGTHAKIAKNMNFINNTWRDKYGGIQTDIERLQAASRLSMSSVTYQLTVTEQLFSRVDFEAMGKGYSIHSSAIRQFENSIRSLAGNFRTLADSIQTPSDLLSLPEITMPGATRELFITGHTIEAIVARDKLSPEIEECDTRLVLRTEQATSMCVSLLQEVNPALVSPYYGARDALRGKRADRSRHVLSSLRELLSHLLRELAPDQEVLSWISKDGRRMHPEGPITRSERVEYIFRMLNHEPLSAFIVKDTQALIEFFNLFNRMHQLDLDMTDDELSALILRTESWIEYILQVYMQI